MSGYLVITNPSADAAALDDALSVLRSHGPVAVRSTSGTSELHQALDAREGATLVVAGGDGTIHAVVAALHRRGELGDTVLGLLPLGTGNDFVRGNALPLDPVEAAQVVVRGRRREIDLILDDTGSVVVNSVHLGAGSEAARRATRWKERLGRIGYPIGALLTAVRPPVLRLRVEVDGAVVSDGRALQVAVGNGPSVGGGAELVPPAHPSDGQLDVVVSAALGGLARMGYAVDLVLRRHHRRPDVTTVRGRSVTVAGESFWCSADGETYGPVSQRTWHVSPAAYGLLVP